MVKKTNVLMIMLVLFSVIADLALPVLTVHAETKEIQLLEENGLKLSYLSEENQWRLNFERQSDEEHQQRLKIRLTDENGQTIKYPAESGMIENGGWLIEENFSEQQASQLTFEIPQSSKQLQLYVEMDQQETTNQENSIQEDILKLEQPFVIELKKTEKTIETTSEEFIGPKKATKPSASIQLTETNRSAGKMYEPIYTNKKPQYTTDDSGTYPAPAWQPENQINVINHQGGHSNQDNWDNVKSWNVAADDHTKSYIKYGEDESNPNISIRKYAQQTEKDDEFKIKLNVKGNVSYEPGVDLVFLLDNSASMLNSGSGSTTSLSRKKNTEAAFEKIIDKLEETYPDNKGGIRIGSHIFSDYEASYWGELDSETNTFQLSANHTDWDKMVKEYARTMSVGTTFTQRGLREAADVFLDAPDIGDRYKLLFVLTDGTPNRSWTPKEATDDPKMYFDPFYITKFTGVGSKGDYYCGSKLGAVGNQTKFPLINGLASSHITTTNSTAKGIKEDEGVEIHTIGVNIEGSSGDHPTDQLKKGLYRMSTKKANTGDKDNPEDYFYYDVSNPDELTEVFKNWYETIIRTVDRGKITDPLGDMVEIVEKASPEKTIKINQVNNGAAEIESKNMPTAQLKDNKRTIETSNINLTGGQEIEIEYTVKLKTDSPSFVSSQWYPANKTTTLEPTPERTTDKIEFGSPSVRYKKLDFVIPLEKVWLDSHQEQDNYWNLRSETITATLQKWNGSGWEYIESKELAEENEWKAEFSPVEGGSNNKYQVIESGRTSGYKEPVVSQNEFTSETLPSDGVKITNELLRGEYQFWKFMEDEKTPFAADLPEFQVKRSDGKILAKNLTPDETGKVTIKAVPIGDYLVEETYVPVGFQKMADFEIDVTENDSAEGLIFKVNGKTEVHTVINKLKDFSLKVEKVDQDGKSLTGASFKLTGPNVEEIKNGGPVFVFANLRPGAYTLTETKAPDSYERILEPITFFINIDGSIRVASHPNVSGTGGTSNTDNLIELKVANTKVREGTLPNTGFYGVHKFYVVAGIFMTIGILLSGAYVYYNRKQ